jgi:hypothetical protein
MRLVWNGRSYRPATNFIKVKDDDINELMKPLSQKTKLGSAVLTGYVINAKPNPEGGDVPVVSPSPTATLTMTPTNTSTSTNTPTPSITPSSTPYILPETPALWYDATNLGSIDYITSGGTDYVSAWRSIGTYQKTVTGTTTNTMPIWSGSSQMPGSPRIVRWNKSSNTALRQFLTQRFDMTPIPQSGITTFVVFANPGYTYGGTSDPNGLAFNLFIVSGNTAGGFNTPAALNYNMFIGSTSNSIQLTNSISGVITVNGINNYSATSLENKFLYTQVSEFSNNRPYFELNQSGGTQPNTITATTVSPINSIALGIGFTTAGVISTGAVNPGIEIGEIMVFNRTLSPSEQEQVQDYLRDKWRYDEWASPVPTPTPTGTQIVTPTPSVTPTNTMTPTNTSTPTPSPTGGFNPNSVPDLFQWFDTSDTSYMTLRSDAGVNYITGWTGKTGGSFTQATASAQPYLVNISGYTYSGASFFGTRWLLNDTISAATPSGTTTFVVGFNDRDVINPALVWDAGTPEGVSSAFLNNNVFQIRGVGRIKGYNAYDTLAKQPKYIAWGYGYGGTDGDGNINGTAFNTDYGSFTAPANITQMRMSSSDTSVDNGGAVYEVLMYNRTLTTSEINSVVTYLQTKWGYSSW